MGRDGLVDGITVRGCTMDFAENLVRFMAFSSINTRDIEIELSTVPYHSEKKCSMLKNTEKQRPPSLHGSQSLRYHSMSEVR